MRRTKGERDAVRQLRNRRAKGTRATPPAGCGPSLRAPTLRIRWDKVGRSVLLVVLVVVVGLYVQQALAYSRCAARPTSSTRSSPADRAGLRLQRESGRSKIRRRSADARALGMVRPGERTYVLTGLPT